MFFRGSRYEGVPEAELATADGRTIRYKRIRFIPETAGTVPYRVQPDDRPDLVANGTPANPDHFWRWSQPKARFRPASWQSTPAPFRPFPRPGPAALPPLPPLLPPPL